MIDLNKLKTSFNIKDIDIAELIRALGEHQHSLINFVLIIGSLLMAGAIFNDHRVKEQDLRSLMSQAQKKLEILKASDAAIQDFNHFKSSLPKTLNESELITVISNYAKLHYVTITSLAPGDSKNMGLYDTISVSFHAVSDNFKEMILFLRKIEKSKFPLMVDSFSGHEVKNGKINFAVEITAVFIHPS